MNINHFEQLRPNVDDDEPGKEENDGTQTQAIELMMSFCRGSVGNDVQVTGRNN